MKENDLRVRTKVYALRIIKLYTALPGTVEAQVLGKQILRSGTSVGRIIAKLVEQNQMRILLAKLKVACRN